jgi:hypothetical protein
MPAYSAMSSARYLPILQREKMRNQLKSDYFARFGITARQFDALRIQLLGKIQAMREQIPIQIENLKRKSKKGKKVLAKIVKLPGSQKLHYKRRRLARLEQRLERLKTGQIHMGFGAKKLSGRKSAFARSRFSGAMFPTSLSVGAPGRDPNEGIEARP